MLDKQEVPVFPDCGGSPDVPALCLYCCLAETGHLSATRIFLHPVALGS